MAVLLAPGREQDTPAAAPPTADLLGEAPRPAPRQLPMSEWTAGWAEAVIVGANTCSRFRSLTQGWAESRVSDVAFAKIGLRETGQAVVAADVESVVRSRSDEAVAQLWPDLALFRDCRWLRRERYSLSIRAVAESTGRLIATSDSLGRVMLYP